MTHKSPFFGQGESSSEGRVMVDFLKSSERRVVERGLEGERGVGEERERNP